MHKKLCLFLQTLQTMHWLFFLYVRLSCTGINKFKNERKTKWILVLVVNRRHRANGPNWMAERASKFSSVFRHNRSVTSLDYEDRPKMRDLESDWGARSLVECVDNSWLLKVIDIREVPWIWSVQSKGWYARLNCCCCIKLSHSTTEFILL